MKRIFLLICTLFLSYLSMGYAENFPSLTSPTPFIYSVNLLTGELEKTSSDTQATYDFYEEGWNQHVDRTFYLASGDFRVGKVKTIHTSEPSAQAIHLFYENGSTCVQDSIERSSVYRYNQKGLIQTVEHYRKEANNPFSTLYRRERLFWKNASPPCLISRVLEEANGQAVVAYHFAYNAQGQLIKESVSGHLSGECQVPLLLTEEGYLIENGIETYSKTYTYAEKDPTLLMKEEEDNGQITTYQYDPVSKQCTAKLSGYASGILSRCFYVYDKEGFLTRTILDDGQGQSSQDLKGVTQRQVIESTLGHEGFLLGQPLKVETRYWDVATQREKVLESVTHSYSAQGQLIQQDYFDANDALRYSVQFEYDAQGQLIATVDSRGKIAEKEVIPSKERYNEQGQLVATLDAYQNETTYTYDAFGRLASTQLPQVLDAWDQPYHPLIKQRYNICDQIVEMIDAQGGVTTLSYNVRGKPTEIHYPDGSSERMSYFLDGVLKQKTARDGTVLTFTRDEAARLIQLEKRSATGQLMQQFSFHYQGERVQSLTDQHMTIHYLYDGVGRQVGILQETTEGTRRLEWDYDDCGQKKQVREWFGTAPEDFIAKIEERDAWQQTQALHFENAQGKVQYKQKAIQEEAASNFVVKQESTTCNSLGQYVKQVEQIDGYGARHLLVYDALQRLESCQIYDAMGMKLRETQWRYDALGNKVLEKHQVLANGQCLRQFVIRWNYDACGRVIAIIEGDQTHTKTTRYQYHPSGHLKEMIKPDGTVISYVYNELGQLASLESSDYSVAYTYAYDDLQRLVVIHDRCHDLMQRRRYNAFHEVIEEEQRPGIKLKNHYDLAGRRLNLILPDHTQVAYHYEGLLLTAVERLNAHQESLYQHIYQYDEEGRLQAEQLLNRLGTVNYHYQQNKLTKIDSPWWSQTIGKEGRGLDGRLRETTIQDVQGQYTSRFTYTADGQLASEEGYCYTYDSLFNRLSENEQKWTVNDLNQLKETPSAHYVYDQNGHVIKKQQAGQSVFYTYDALDRLIRIEYPRQKAVSYVYDSFHRRLTDHEWEWNNQQQTWDLKSQVHLFYDDCKEIGKLNAQDEIVELRILGVGRGAEISAAVALELHNRLFVPLHDVGGSVCCLIDAQEGIVSETYRYSAYGKEKIYDVHSHLQEQSAVGNSWRFCSKRTEDGLIFFGKRYYDPMSGRWLTPDPLFFYDTPNLYAFNRNDPLNCYDLYGLFSISDIWDYFSQSFYAGFDYLRISAHHLKSKLNAELKFPEEWGTALEKVGKQLLGESTYLLMGHSFEDTYVGSYGKQNIHDKVRVTFINGILTTHNMIRKNLEIISQSHGGAKVHYVFRPTEGWTWDISRGILIKTAFHFGFRSLHACLLAQMWHDLIAEMGGVEGGGVIIHYAHSLGGSETDRARELLSPEEQKMIRVHTFGSATLVRNVGFQSVVNHISVKDGVSSFLLEPLGHIRNYFDPETNVRTYGSFWRSPYWPTDHILSGPTYGPIVYELGEKFLAEFASQKEE